MTSSDFPEAPTAEAGGGSVTAPDPVAGLPLRKARYLLDAGAALDLEALDSALEANRGAVQACLDRQAAAADRSAFSES